MNKVRLKLMFLANSKRVGENKIASISEAFLCETRLFFSLFLFDSLIWAKSSIRFVFWH